MKKELYAFIGIDGSGKSTIIKEVKKKLEKKGVTTKTVYMGLGSEHNFKPLQWIMKLRAKRNKKKEQGNEKKLKDHNYRERNLLWVLGQYSELLLRYKKAKKKTKEKTILFDRYFYDGLILGNKKTYHLMKYLTPKPTKSFLIKAPATTIRKRKQEADIPHIKKYYNNAKRLYKDFNIIEIDNSKPIKEVTKKIMEEIEKKQTF